ncbi:unnamed protein product [Durusdinium trenchii]|uniref:Uncharacterized protein n=1 Tax=Durusdinium trenchii TaxID=1381693 RepID=A0ABP0KMX8_9DINO
MTHTAPRQVHRSRSRHAALLFVLVGAWLAERGVGRVFVDGFASRRQATHETPSAPSIFGGESIYETIRWYQPPAREYSRRELIADRLVNFGGVGLALLAAPILALRSRTGGDPGVKQLGLWIHAFCMILMFTCSALFHYWAWDERNQRFLLMLDHIGINSMIAGCYTPLMIHCGCYRMLAFVWTCAVIGFSGEITLYSIWQQTMQDLQEIESTLHVGGMDLIFHHARYLMMGWSVVVIWNQVCMTLNRRGGWWHQLHHWRSIPPLSEHRVPSCNVALVRLHRLQLHVLRVPPGSGC